MNNKSQFFVFQNMNQDVLFYSKIKVALKYYKNNLYKIYIADCCNDCKEENVIEVYCDTYDNALNMYKALCERYRVLEEMNKDE